LGKLGSGPVFLDEPLLEALFAFLAEPALALICLGETVLRLRKDIKADLILSV
jgi:hypothetical protein